MEIIFLATAYWFIIQRALKNDHGCVKENKFPEL